MSLDNRLKTHTHLAAKLASFSDAELAQLVQQAEPLHSGTGGSSALLTLDGTRIFVKKIPLTDLEKEPQNIKSTANIFELPLFYQYGIGSAGFGAWRELAAHTITTDWVLSGECLNFPIMYHWRVLPTAKPEPMNSAELEILNSRVQYWDNSPAIRNRLEAIHNASHQIVLFLEYFPETLYQWLGTKLKEGGHTSDQAVSFVDETLQKTNNFMNSHGLLHFDAHFQNILIADELVVSDFGLALSSKFDLTNAEIEFFNTHQNYDRCGEMVDLLYCIITSLADKDHWAEHLRNYVNGESNELRELSPYIATTVKLYAPLVLVLAEFYRNLRNESKSTPYPTDQVKSLLKKIEPVYTDSISDLARNSL